MKYLKFQYLLILKLFVLVYGILRENSIVYSKQALRLLEISEKLEQSGIQIFENRNQN